MEQAARYLGIGRNSAYEAIHRGDLPALRIGRLLRVSRYHLEQLVRGRQALTRWRGHEPGMGRWTPAVCTAGVEARAQTEAPVPAG